MKFFIPHAKDAAEAESVRRSVREFLSTQGLGTTERRIASITFRHNGKPYDAHVGKTFPDLREEVLVILEGINPRLCYICTANRGVVRGEPYLVGNDDSTGIIDFDE